MKLSVQSCGTTAVTMVPNAKAAPTPFGVKVFMQSFRVYGIGFEGGQDQSLVVSNPPGTGAVAEGVGGPPHWLRSRRSKATDSGQTRRPGAGRQKPPRAAANTIATRSNHAAARRQPRSTCWRRVGAIPGTRSRAAWGLAGQSDRQEAGSKQSARFFQNVVGNGAAGRISYLVHIVEPAQGADVVRSPTSYARE